MRERGPWFVPGEPPFAPLPCSFPLGRLPPRGRCRLGAHRLPSSPVGTCPRRRSTRTPHLRRRDPPRRNPPGRSAPTRKPPIAGAGVGVFPAGARARGSAALGRLARVVGRHPLRSFAVRSILLGSTAVGTLPRDGKVPSSDDAWRQTEGSHPSVGRLPAWWEGSHAWRRGWEPSHRWQVEGSQGRAPLSARGLLGGFPWDPQLGAPRAWRHNQSNGSVAQLVAHR